MAIREKPPGEHDADLDREGQEHLVRERPEQRRVIEAAISPNTGSMITESINGDEVGDEPGGRKGPV